MTGDDGQRAIYERLSSLEQRMKTVEHALDMSTADIKDMRDDLKQELSRQSEELAMTRQAVRIFEDVARGLGSQLRTIASESSDRIGVIAKESKEMLAMFHDYRVKDASDKSKVLVGVVIASGSGTLSLAVLTWVVTQLVNQ